jgi:hypothetical protein
MMSSGQIIGLKTSVARKYNDLMRARAKAVAGMSEENQNHLLTETDINLPTQFARMQERETFLQNAPEGDATVRETSQMLFDEKKALIMKYGVPVSPNSSVAEVRTHLLFVVDREFATLEKNKVRDKDAVLLCDNTVAAALILNAIPEVDAVPVATVPETPGVM